MTTPDRDAGFYEDDQPADEIAAAFQHGEKGVTRPPDSRIPWRTRWTVLAAAVLTAVTGRHHYVSTACLHGVPGRCRSRQRHDHSGPKQPMTCKFCAARCRHDHPGGHRGNPM